MKAIIFAAGYGTRLHPITKNKPKALAEYKGKTLLQFVIEKLATVRCEEIIINVHHFSEQIIKFLSENKNFGQKIIISHEKEAPLETGGGLFYASKNLGDKPFFVYNVDILSNINLKAMYNYHLKQNSIATLAVQDRQSNKKLYFNINNQLCKWRNEKTDEEKIVRTCDNTIGFAFSGIHVIDPRIFKYMNAGKYSIIDTYLEVAKTEKISYFEHSDDVWADMGRLESYSRDIL